MKIRTFACAAAVAAVPASAQDLGLMVDLLPGHPVYHELQQEAGVVMAISVTPDEADAADLRGLCEELRAAAGLGRANADGLPLEVIFIVPYKGMAVEGYYLPAQGTDGTEELVRGRGIARATLDGIVARAGIPSRLLDETDVEHEISCEMNEPAWLVRWEDVRSVHGEEPDAVIAHAGSRFLAIHRSVVEHAAGDPQRAASLRIASSTRPAPAVAAEDDAPGPGPAHPGF